MGITINSLLSFLSDYLLAVTVCFIGCFVNEAYSSIKSKTKINLIRILLGGILGAFLSCCVYRILESHKGITIELEIFMAICFGIGFFSGKILDILTNKTLAIKFLQTVISKTGEPGKAFVKAWKESEKEAKEKKEKEKLASKNKNNDEKEKEDDKESDEEESQEKEETEEKLSETKKRKKSSSRDKEESTEAKG